MHMAVSLKKQLTHYANTERKKTNEWFFKTGKGEYSEHDKFIGVAMPDLRRVVKANPDASFKDIQPLLKSKIHEERLLGLLLLVQRYEKSKEKQRVFDFYVKNLSSVNNWDLVDVTVPKVIGAHLVTRKRTMLYTLAKSKDLWERRISIVATFAFIHKKQYKDTVAISEMLLKDKHDLIHKAVGWALREVGKKDIAVLKKFLKTHAKTMPRTTLRYAIERFDEKTRKHYLISSKQ